MTYSILALDPEAGEIGVAVQSHFFAVGSCVPWAQAGVGVVASQSIVEPAYGVRGLSLMAQGRSPQQVLDSLLADDAGAPTRQVAMLGVSGAGATHTGPGCIGHAGHCVRQHSRTQANLVAAPQVWTAMAEEFEGAAGSLAQRLLAALRAGEAQGGDLRGQQAAALKVVRTVATGDLNADVVVDLRVDDADRPLDELDRLLTASQTLAGLLRLLQTPGLLIGEFAVAEETLTDALGELDRAQTLAGVSNAEPTVWKGLLLARAGRTDAARSCFASAGRVNPRTAELLRRLAAAGMWTRDPAELETLLPP
ncbi:DUF1028 domain-containing protein [Pseudonocardia hispaniensis]|uniref:DUF1028 domain-containing protein n=1 Tax=Pseudonocardia hispaniensis TaxID=904933 RepID=A0ABW1J8R4_9PSEU